MAFLGPRVASALSFAAVELPKELESCRGLKGKASECLYHHSLGGTEVLFCG